MARSCGGVKIDWYKWLSDWWEALIYWKVAAVYHSFCQIIRWQGRYHETIRKTVLQDFSGSILELFNLTKKIFGFEILLSGCKQPVKDAGHLPKGMRIPSQAKLRGRRVAKKKVWILTVSSLRYGLSLLYTASITVRLNDSKMIVLDLVWNCQSSS